MYGDKTGLRPYSFAHLMTQVSVAAAPASPAGLCLSLNPSGDVHHCISLSYFVFVWASEALLPPGSISPIAQFAPAGSVCTVHTLNLIRAQRPSQRAAIITR